MSNIKVFSFPQNKKFRIIANDVCFYATKKQIMNGIGDFSKFNDALQVLLAAFDYEKTLNKESSGFAGNCRGYSLQINA